MYAKTFQQYYKVKITFEILFLVREIKEFFIKHSMKNSLKQIVATE